MPKGRCVGCGLENSSAKLVERHIQKCPEYLEVYRADPSKALDPVEAAAAHDALKQTDEYIEQREEEKDARYDGFREAAARKVEALRERWRGGTKFRAVNRRATPVPPPEQGRVWGLSPEDFLAQNANSDDLAARVAAERLVGITGVETQP